MEPVQKRTSRLIFALIFVFDLVFGVLDGYREFLPLTLRSQEISLASVGWYMSMVSAISFVVSPVLLFIAMYLVGRRFDLKEKLASAIVLLLLGGYVGEAVGHLISPLIVFGLNYDMVFASLTTSLIPTITLSNFFVAFTGLATAYIRYLER